MKIIRYLWMLLGFIGLVVGAIGAVIPMLPSVPFLLLAAFGFSKSSKKLHSWFIETKLYKNNLESYVKGQGMTLLTKIKIMIMVTILLSFGFYMMFDRDLYIPCIILAIIWLFHMVYFMWGVKTYKSE